MRRVHALIVCFLLVLIGLGSPALAAKRVALVIGNSAYQSVPRLANPANDAAAVAEGLKRLGFKVEHRPDLDYRNFRRVLSKFSRLADGADIALIYYAGHGIEIGKRNYLVPVDAQLRDARDAELEALPLDVVLTTLEGASKLRLVILDACRNNPFRARMTKRGGTRSVGRGAGARRCSLQHAGRLRRQGGHHGGRWRGGPLSPYTTALLKHLETPGLEINFLFRRVRDSVLGATGGRQEPFIYGSLSSEAIYLKPGPDAGAPAAAVPVQPGLSAAAQAWSVIKGSEDKAILEAFIARFGDSFYATLAKSRMAALQPPQEAESGVPDVTMELQKALKAVNCYSGKIDGIWGSGSRSALRSFAEVTGRDLSSNNASTTSLEFVRRHSETTCTSQPDKQKISKSGKMSAKSYRALQCKEWVPLYRKGIASGGWNTLSDLSKFVRETCKIK